MSTVRRAWEIINFIREVDKEMRIGKESNFLSQLTIKTLKMRKGERNHILFKKQNRNNKMTN
jgi:hypothetical protein